MKALLVSTHGICFPGEIGKNIFLLPLLSGARRCVSGQIIESEI